jgi:hypothetical protein
VGGLAAGAEAGGGDLLQGGQGQQPLGAGLVGQQFGAGGPQPASTRSLLVGSQAGTGSAAPTVALNSLVSSSAACAAVLAARAQGDCPAGVIYRTPPYSSTQVPPPEVGQQHEQGAIPCRAGTKRVAGDTGGAGLLRVEPVHPLRREAVGLPQQRGRLDALALSRQADARGVAWPARPAGGAARAVWPRPGRLRSAGFFALGQ